MFYQIDDYQGVDIGAPTPSIMIPSGGCNLVAHDQGRSARLDVRPGLDIYDVTDSLSKGVIDALDFLRVKVKGTLDTWTLSDLLSDAVKLGLNQTRRLIAISSRAAGEYKLKIEGKPINVEVRDQRTVTLSFVYYRYNGKDQDKLALWNKMGGGVDSNTHSRNGVDKANIYFVPQANIFFQRKAVHDWSTDDWLETTTLNNRNILSYPAIDHITGRHIAEAKADPSADVTVIVVPTVRGGANAFELPPDLMRTTRSVFVPWFHFPRDRRPNSTNPNADLFIPELCHELVHALGQRDHSDRANVMCNTHKNSYLENELLIDKETLDLINPVIK